MGVPFEPSSSSDPHMVRLAEILISCSHGVCNGGISEAGILTTKLAECLDSISADSASDPDNEEVQRTSDAMLSAILEFVKSSSTDQEVIDALSFELPKAVCKFSGASGRYLKVVEMIIDQLARRCHPRDMISFFCEALDYQNEQIKVSGFVSPLLTGLAIVFKSIKRRHLEQFKVVIPLIFRALEQACLEEDEDQPLEDLFDRALDIGCSVHAVSQNLEGESRKKLQALLGLYTLQIMAYVSINITNEDQSCLQLVLELTNLLQCCDLSYIELITGSAVDKLSNIIGKEEDEDLTLSSFFYIKHGACLSVIWSCISNDTSLSVKESMLDVTNELRSSQSKRWQAIGMLKYIFSSPNIPLRFKGHAIDFVHKIIVGDPSQGCDNGLDIFESYSSIFAALQGIQMVIIQSPTELKRKAFGALKGVIADIPASQRLDMLEALITNSNSPSMSALLMDCLRDEMRKEIHQQPKDPASPEKPFWTESVIELIGSILRPSSGRPPFLPEESDVVLSALNLYRFIIIMESTGHTNYTKVLSEINLKKASTEWFLPLMHLVTAMMSVKNEEDETLDAEICASLNPLQMVLQRCIELVEEKLKNKVQQRVEKHPDSDHC